MNDNIELFTQIAREHLDIETLETRKMDGLDFHEVAVWQLEKALRAAYEAGRESMRRRRTKPTQPKKTPRPRP
jgi:hypothetical protein